jgi:hypothetical protein
MKDRKQAQDDLDSVAAVAFWDWILPDRAISDYIALYSDLLGATIGIYRRLRLTLKLVNMAVRKRE